MGTETTFKLFETEGIRKLKVMVKGSDIGLTTALLISPEGYGECNALGGKGSPIMLEIWEGKLRLIVWADINQEDPTHIIDLEGARETNRKPETT